VGLENIAKEKTPYSI